MENPYIPKQQVGSKVDISSAVEFNSNAEAITFFQTVKHRLLNVNQWAEICKAPSSTFKLINARNQEIAGLVKETDYIRINVPGPGTKLGEGFDWVNVESIKEEVVDQLELVSITVRPSNHPLKSKNEIAHFFQSTATSTFQAIRNKNKVYAEVHGRNELPNNRTRNFFDSIRNTLIGWSAKIGFSYPQWKLLVEGLISK
jgi:hypothetical protein